MNVTRETVSVTTAADGSATAYSGQITGRIHSIHYVKNNFDDGVDFTITLEATGESLWTDTNVNASEKVYPVVAANLGGTGGASTLTEVPLYAANDRVKIIIAQGGNVKTGAFRIVTA